MIGRRTFLLAAGSAAALLPTRPALAAAGAEWRIKEAMEHAGGWRALERVNLLKWQGRGVVHAAGRQIHIGVSTSVAPFSWAKSDSWLISEGPKSTRSMLITPDGGWDTTGGRTVPLPPGIVAHEREQFAIYGMMLLAPLLKPRVVLRSPPKEEHGRDRGYRRIEVLHPLAPRTTLLFDGDWRLYGAENVVAEPDGEGKIDQRFLFSSERMPGPVRWPRRMSIEHNGKLFFQLELDSFEALG